MSTETNPTPTPAASGMDGKTIATISYLTLIGWIIAYVMYGNNKSQLAIYHIRQSLFLIFIWIAIWILRWVLLFIPFIGWALWWATWLLIVGLVVLWVMGLVAAINGEEKPVPLVGNTAQKMLAGIK
jgi:uncharacterized membrane protein